eukprot:gene22179-biopygen7833
MPSFRREKVQTFPETWEAPNKPIPWLVASGGPKEMLLEDGDSLARQEAPSHGSADLQAECWGGVHRDMNKCTPRFLWCALLWTVMSMHAGCILRGSCGMDLPRSNMQFSQGHHCVQERVGGQHIGMEYLWDLVGVVASTCTLMVT